MILLIDNYDSFTYNLVQMLAPLGIEVKVFRNDQIDIDGMRSLAPSALMISPGPGTPIKAGISIDAIINFGGEIPILGVCLGHQAVVEAFGGKVVRADRIMHGKTSMIRHDGKGIFKDLDNPFEAVRYHSLIADKDTLPGCFEISAWTDEGEIMGVRHHEFRVNGVQFHPESILTKAGTKLMDNFLYGGSDND